ncbi:insulinase family protein [Marinobacter sp. M216]|uniref:Insulinase family protein n=1 Tax=Marinobacter albus TaxID=3030833 RepID=A0ABT7HD05_9GAMM|nr:MULTISPECIES: insulinase family protein [unclassified Marinobacter]MBW7470284.1 insulinase family protein [Marinobacter sp. F4218]MDK9557451.1 insulinase family protein [Marinobacter sp. M216]
MASEIENAVHPAFEKLRSHRIGTLNLDVEEYRHKKTGARHLHLAADNDENVFFVALRTFPMDSTGVAHILEHTALCGSERYPVRDPFFMMIRRSLNTFMNAFTSSDWTAYPFASMNRKDFDNLLSVYLDSVFFSKLDQLDFAQEGHRLEFDTPDNPDTDLVYRGVVYNEMKGAMSSPTSQLWQNLSSHLFPTTTYHYNSGGEPDHIVDLSYDDLVRFYRHHYHPSNAIFATYGNIPASEHHERFEELALKRFDRLDIELPVRDEKRMFSPVRVEQGYAVNEGEGTEKKTHIVVGWLLGHSFDLQENLEGQLLSAVLLENSASPLMRALETTDLGHAPSPMCGLEDSNREMTFVCGIEGSEPERQKELETLIEGTLLKVAEEGVSEERLEAILHQLELHQREIAGDQFPYGLQLIMSAIAPMVHGGDPVELLDLEPVLESLREKIRDPQYVPNLIRRKLLENPHRVTLTLRPDEKLESHRQQAIREALARRKAELTDEEIQQIVERAAALEKRQMRKDDDSILPKVDLSDVPLQMPEPESRYDGDISATVYSRGTNGLVYEQVVVPVPALTEEELLLVPYYTTLISEVGCGDLDYLQMQDRISAESGGIGASFSAKGKVDDVQDLSGYIVFNGKALARNRSELTALLRDVYTSARFDEKDRIREIIAQIRTRREQAVTGSGHALAMGAAAQGMSPGAWLSFRLGGLAGIRGTKQLDQALNDPQELDGLCAKLSALHDRIRNQSREFLIVGEEDQLPAMVDDLKSCWQGEAGTEMSPWKIEPVNYTTREAWLTSTQVNFCAKAYSTVPVDHPDAAALTVLGGFLRNGYLHRVIREKGGAYGGGAGQDSVNGTFRFFSYRDPRLAETLDDFDRALEWLQTTDHDYQELEESILGVIGQLDRPRSPAGAARHAFHNKLFGRSPEQRARFRERVLAVTLDDLKRVASTWLMPENASIAVVTSPENRKVAEELGLAIEEM